jgi:hydrogenase maturation protease
VRILVLACGNPLREDDGAAWQVARHVLDSPRPAGIDLEVVTCMQYLPEMAEAVSRADIVVFVDASVDVSPGSARLSAMASGDSVPAALTHHFNPAGLIDLGLRLYGTAPARVHLLEIGAAEFDMSEEVSEPVERGIELAARLLGGLLDQQAAVSRQPSAVS